MYSTYIYIVDKLLNIYLSSHHNHISKNNIETNFYLNIRLKCSNNAYRLRQLALIYTYINTLQLNIKKKETLLMR